MNVFADDKLKVTEKLKCVLGRVENIVEKKEKMLAISIFFISHNVSRGFFLKVIKSQDCVVKNQPFPKQALVFTCLQYESFENTVGKRRNCS